MISTQALISQFKGFLEAKDGYIYGTSGEIWTAAKQNAATREQTILYGKKWIGHHVEDCSGAFTRAFKALGGYMYHGSNTMYREYCTAKGTLSGGKRTDGQELKPGTAVFTGTESDHGHVGLYIGDGEVIEAASTAKGVVKSSVTNKKWTYWGELKGVDYGGEPVPETKPTIRKGSRGEYVKEAQQILIDKGYDLGKWGADGVFGDATEAAVKRFQTAAGLTADGVVGPKTWEALEKPAPVTMLYTVHVPHCTKYQAEALVNQYSGAYMTEERS